MTLSMNLQFFVVYDNNYSTVVYGGNIITSPQWRTWHTSSGGQAAASINFSDWGGGGGGELEKCQSRNI